jgi:CheY-like chemotaxis protein
MRHSHLILLVDDDRDIVEVASRRLQAAGFETMTAQDGPRGVSLALAHHPDAIVLDVRMPHMDGLAALRQLQSDEKTRDIPVVMLSASIVDRSLTLDAGARFFVRKPYQGTTLVAAICSVLSEAVPI